MENLTPEQMLDASKLEHVKKDETRCIQLIRKEDGTRSPEVVATREKFVELIRKHYSEEDLESFFVLDVTPIETTIDDKPFMVMSRLPIMKLKTFVHLVEEQN